MRARRLRDGRLVPLPPRVDPPDCSKKIPPGAWRVRSDFSLGSEGWRSHNNSCAGVLETIVSNVPEIGHPDAVAKAIRGGACANDGDGGDGGVEWDGAAGHLYLTDRLPSDGDGEIAYFRAPGKFLGDVLSTAYDGTLSYELYLGGGDASRGAGAPVGVPHAPDTDAERAPT